MTQGLLIYSIIVTGYMFFGVRFEKRDLMKTRGEDYIAHRKRTPILLPMPWRSK